MLLKLPEGPLLWLPLTLASYMLASKLWRATGKSPLLNPTLVAICAVSGTLLVSRVPYSSYFESVSVLHYLLGTAVVALAVPLYRNMRHLGRDLPLIVAAIAAGSIVSSLIGVVVAHLFGGSLSTLLSIAPKSATAAVSVEIAGLIGGIPAVTACLTILTGITGAVLGPSLLTWIGVLSPTARGVALGTASHGIATARAFAEGELAGSAATLAMSINAVLTSAAIPLIISMLPLPR